MEIKRQHIVTAVSVAYLELKMDVLGLCLKTEYEVKVYPEFAMTMIN
jgi:hypothetical protein